MILDQWGRSQCGYHGRIISESEQVNNLEVGMGKIVNVCFLLQGKRNEREKEK